MNICLKHHQNITNTSLKHFQNIPKTSPKHTQRILKTSPTHTQNITKTSPKHINSSYKDSAAGAFFPKRCLKNHGNIRFFEKYNNHNKKSYMLCRRRFFPQKCKIVKNMRNSETPYKRGHLYSAAGAFFPHKCLKIHENMRMSKIS